MTDKGDKFPCATCPVFGECQPALELFKIGKALGKDVTAIGITCPKDGITYRSERVERKENDR